MKGERKTALVIRFKGFSDAWEQRELMSVFEFPVSTNSLSRSQLNYDNGEIKSVHYGDILVNYDSILEIAKDRIPFITNGVIDKYKPNLLENGDLIFADAAEDETVGKAVEVDGKINEYIVAGLHTIVARPRRKMAKFFWGYYINSSIYHNQLLRLMQGTKVASISKSNLQKTCIAYPDNFAEQQKLGNFFKQLDDTIALHQRKLEALKLMKKGFLQQIFPKKGEKVPRLRFADFPDEWEQCIVSDFTDKTYGGGTPKTNIPEYWTGEIPWIQSSDLIKDDFFNVAPKKHITEDAIRNSSTKLVPSNSITVVTRVGVGKLAFMPFEYATSQDFLSLSNLKVSLIFGVYSLYNMLQKELNNIQGTSIKGITKSDLLEKSITIPVEVEEQKKIGFLFKQLDDIILFHKNKLNQFQALKKAYLQNMFI
ncbi:restriction endonuclease subunit S [Listeria seeligeri]|uniref:restriction endonuclease subunit S n=1 Tax=Listeria seeligeri TaxID=1640 RepID=UPI0016247517|nr:restriction endonuclease subunit S [Listeria seeligeri]MBC2071113.1 restriction endonuclease subunit S [Listeria seeligeri]MBF2355259.1 restriction endonuclease subunit S [Listeria seeligeri]